MNRIAPSIVQSSTHTKFQKISDILLLLKRGRLIAECGQKSRSTCALIDHPCKNWGDMGRCLHTLEQWCLRPSLW